jgi:hypothetical protein
VKTISVLKERNFTKSFLRQKSDLNDLKIDQLIQNGEFKSTRDESKFDQKIYGSNEENDNEIDFEESPRKQTKYNFE